MKSLAVDGSGAHVFQWNAGKDQITVAEEVEKELGLDPGALNVAVEDFLQHMHASDRERFRLMLWSLQEKQGGDLHDSIFACGVTTAPISGTTCARTRCRARIRGSSAASG